MHSENDTGTKEQSVNKTPRSAGEQSVTGTLSVGRKLLFTAIAVCVFFVGLELLLGLLGIKPVLYERDPYVGFSSYIPLFVEQQAPDGQRVMVTAENKLTWFNPQQFSRDKDPDAYRIFCVGGSTTYGRPYTDTTSFCGWLRAMLPKADPARKWELVNAGGISYASYRVAMQMEELIQYKPDLFIVYSGQNEFLENRTYDQMIRMPGAVRGLGAIASKTRTYTAVKQVIDRLKKQTVSKTSHGADLAGEVNTILENTVGTEAYHRDLQLQQQIFDHYRYNLMRMIDIARSVGAEVILVRPASKLRECSPFKSEHRAGLVGDVLQQWQGLFDAASAAFAEERWDKALEAVNQALAIDDQYADLHYLHGRVLWRLERYDEAKKAFIRARDEDICPLRALTPMENIVPEVAAQRDVPLVDFIELTQMHSEHATPGDDVFLDHVHPTIESNRLMALALLETMARQGIMHPAQTWNDTVIGQVKEDVESRLDVNAHAVALANMAQLYAWCAKFEDGYRMALRAIKMSPTVAPAYLQAAVNVANLGRVDEAADYYRQYLQFEPDTVAIQVRLGQLLASQGKLDEAAEHYRRALQTNPLDASAHSNLAIAFQAQGRLDEALEHYRQALQANPSDAQTHNNLATALKSLGMTDEATEHYYQAIKADPDFFESHYNLALTFMMQAQYDKALEHFQQVHRIKGDWPDVLVGIAFIFATHPDAKKRDPNQAIALAERAVMLNNSQDARSLDILGMAYASAGRFDEAVAAAQKALSLASAANANETVQRIQRRLELYRQGKPFVSPAPK